MGAVQVLDVHGPESMMNLFQRTLVVAATKKVMCPNPADHERPVFESERSGFSSKLFGRPPGTKLLRTVASKVTMKSATDSTGT